MLGVLDTSVTATVRVSSVTNPVLVRLKSCSSSEAGPGTSVPVPPLPLFAIAVQLTVHVPGCSTPNDLQVMVRPPAERRVAPCTIVPSSPTFWIALDGFCSVAVQVADGPSIGSVDDVSVSAEITGATTRLTSTFLESSSVSTPLTVCSRCSTSVAPPLPSVPVPGAEFDAVTETFVSQLPTDTTPDTRAPWQSTATFAACRDAEPWTNSAADGEVGLRLGTAVHEADRRAHALCVDPQLGRRELRRAEPDARGGGSDAGGPSEGARGEVAVRWSYRRWLGVRR